MSMNFIVRWLSAPLLFLSIQVSAQPTTEEVVQSLAPNPLFIIDSVKVTRADLQKYDAESITLVTILKDSSMIKQYGGEVKGGVVLIETRNFARKKFVHFLRSASADYDSLYTSNRNDTSFCYILNDKVLNGNYEGQLSGLNNTLFISLEILSPKELKDQFAVNDKKHGVLIKAKEPGKVYNSDKKL